MATKGKAAQQRRTTSQVSVTSYRRRVRRPKLEAFYVQLFIPLVRRARFKYRLSNEDARDIVQEAFALAIVKLRSARDAPAWFKRVVDLLAKNLIRTGVRRAELLARWSVREPTEEKPEEI